MFSNTLMSIVILSLYILGIINVILLFIILFVSLKYNIEHIKYMHAYEKMKPIVTSFIEKDHMISCLLPRITNSFYDKVVLDILLEYCKEYKANLSDKFERLGYDVSLIRKAERHADLKLLQKISLIKSPKAYNLLLKNAESGSFEISYMSYYGLSLLPQSDRQLHIFIKSILESGFLRDRIIEMIINLNLDYEKYLDLLDEQVTELGKIVFIRALEHNKGIKYEDQSDRLIKYLEESKEIRISTINTLAASGNEKYLNNIADLYEYEQEWEVRVAIAKSMRNFKNSQVVLILKKMMCDKEWWVRFNAVEVLSRHGREGIDTLIDIALDDSDPKTSGLAYYILNANKSVFNTLTQIKQEAP